MKKVRRKMNDNKRYKGLRNIKIRNAKRVCIANDSEMYNQVVRNSEQTTRHSGFSHPQMFPSLSTRIRLYMRFLSTNWCLHRCPMAALYRDGIEWDSSFRSVVRCCWSCSSELEQPSRQHRRLLHERAHCALLPKWTQLEPLRRKLLCCGTSDSPWK